ncbi:MAG: prolipoprotein diacylglyceryl transferase [Candidatus Pacebacteria bacterium]|nr:prolipoprotein diacylglyceryl transferase [Candidatus Paceibacterota bacterium]
MIPYFSFSEISIGLITFQVWGLMASLGFLGVSFLFLKEARKKDINGDYIWELLPLLIIAMIVGAKVFYIISNFDVLQDEKNLILSNGGFSLIGGIFFAGIVFYFYTKLKKINFYKLTDVFVPGAILAIIIIRVGCFLVYDHIGQITTLPWGRVFLDGTIRHPVILYHIASGLVIFLIICYLKTRQTKEGFLSFVFVFYYVVSRFLIDFFRCDDSSFCDSRYAGFTYTQWIILFFLPLIFFLAKRKKCFNKLIN